MSTDEAPQNELARLQAENARLRAMIDRLERQQRQALLNKPAANQAITGTGNYHAPAQKRAKSKKIRDSLIGPFWNKQTLPGYSGSQMLMAIAISNLFYAVAFLLTFALAEPNAGPPTPWAWVFIFVLASPLFFMLIAIFYIGYQESKSLKGVQAAKGRPHRFASTAHAQQVESEQTHKDKEADHQQDAIIRLQIENARQRATIDRLEHQRRQENPASAKTEARSKKILLLGIWLLTLALSNMAYGVALVVTISLADPGTNRPTPWVWIFLFVFITPLLLLVFVGLMWPWTRSDRRARQSQGSASEGH